MLLIGAVLVIAAIVLMFTVGAENWVWFMFGVGIFALVFRYVEYTNEMKFSNKKYSVF